MGACECSPCLVQPSARCMAAHVRVLHVLNSPRWAPWVVLAVDLGGAQELAQVWASAQGDSAGQRDSADGGRDSV